MLSTGENPVGLASGDLAELGQRTIAAWDAFLELTADVDLEQPTRLPKWRIREVLVHLGAWDDHEPLAAAVTGARTGVLGPTIDPDRTNARLVRSRANVSYVDVHAALVRHRKATAGLISRNFNGFAHRQVMSALGPLPLATYVHAGCYELAVHALDVADATGRDVSRDLLDAGLAALMDVTGALATRLDLDVGTAAQTPFGGWRFRREAAGWVTEEVPAGKVTGVAVLGTHEDLLDASAGRVNAPALLLQRRLRVQQLGRFLELGTIVREVPHLPGGAVLGKAAGGMASLAGRFRFVR